MTTITLFAVGFLSPVAHADQTNSAAALKGTWTGTSSGYKGSTYTGGGFQKIVITNVKGSSARGTWQFKTSAAAKWSSPEPLTLSVFAGSDGDLRANGVDSGGTYFGHLFPRGVWTLTYEAPDRLESLRFDLKKK